jgi:murein L,D-transpeptidase YafK
MKKVTKISIAVIFFGVALAWAVTGVASESGMRDSDTRQSKAQPQNGGFIKTSFSTRQRFRPGNMSADRVLVEKTKRRLTLLSDGQILKQYRISLGRNPVGTKVRDGDNRTPEGIYHIDYRIQDSDYHMALHISYPSEADRRRARQMGYSPGGSIMVHGLKNDDDEIAYYHGYFDWTKGCIAVTNAEIEEIWQLVPNGTTIEIRP